MKIEYLADHHETIPTLARWSYEEWSYLHPERSFAEFERRISAGSNKKQLPITLVALAEGKVSGMISLKASDYDARPDLGPWLAGMFVDKPRRKRGVGAALVLEIEKLAASRGVNKLFLVTDDAQAFYSKLGWNVLEHSIWQGHSVTVMEKEIARER